MDNAVALVETYLHLNGYFTVAEYPVTEAMREDGYREATDIDLLAFRLPHAGGLVPSGRHRETAGSFTPDAALEIDPDGADVLICEVKEGMAELNRGARDPDVLAAVLARFGCCPRSSVQDTVRELRESGEARTEDGNRIRLLAFGSQVKEDRRGYGSLSLGHVVEFLQRFLQDNWNILRHVRVRNPAFGFLAMLEKARRGTEP